MFVNVSIKYTASHMLSELRKKYGGASLDALKTVNYQAIEVNKPLATTWAEPK